MLAAILAATLTASQIDSVVTNAEAAFHDYVFPDVAAKAVAMLKTNAAKYRTFTDPQKFADAVDADLIQTTHDKHVQIYYPYDPDTMSPTQGDAAAEHRMEAFLDYEFTTVRRLPGNVGYIDFVGFSSDAQAGQAIHSAMAFVSSTDALIINLRNNGGGDSRTASALEGYFFSGVQPMTSTMVRDPATGMLSETQQYTSPSEPGSLYVDKPVYLLTSNYTFSCAEQFAYDLQSLKRVTIVGEVTGGGANPGDFKYLGNHFDIFMPNGYAQNPITKKNWEGVGVQPDVSSSANDAFTTAYRLALGKVRGTYSDPAIRERIDQAIKDAGRLAPQP